jgi:hypothetical protein
MYEKNPAFVLKTSIYKQNTRNVLCNYFFKVAFSFIAVFYDNICLLDRLHTSLQYIYDYEYLFSYLPPV